MVILIVAHDEPVPGHQRPYAELGGFVMGLDVPPLVDLTLILVCYLVLGCFLEGFAMLVMTCRSCSRSWCGWDTTRSGSVSWSS